MISKTLSDHKPISNSPTIAPLGLNRQTAISALRFGSSDTATTTASLPKWTQQVKDPAITAPQLIEAIKNLQAKATSSNPPGFFSNIWQVLKLARQGRKLYNELNNENLHLPKQAKDDLRKYHWTPGYWYNRVFHSQKAKLMDVVYKGPMAIKAKQQAVSLLPLFKEAVKNMDAEGDKLTGLTKRITKVPIRYFKKQIKKIEIYTPLLNHVPELPYSKFEKQLTELKLLYNKDHDDPIVSIDKTAIGTGSIGQVYKATTKNGTKLVIKVIKPNLTESYLDEFLPYVYYRNMLTEGTKPQNKQAAVEQAQSTINLLKSEIHPDQETKNTKLMKQWVTRLSPISFQVPDILAHTSSGLISPFVGEKDFANASSTEQTALKNKIAPDLARFLLIASAKPLDLQDGNMRTGNQTAYWIDHGRQVNITEDTHHKMLQLMVTAFKSPKIHSSLSVWENALLQTETRTKLKSLLEVNPVANKLALQNLNTLDTIADLQNQVIQQATLKQKLTDEQFNNLRPTETETEKQIKKELVEIKKPLQAFNDATKQLSQILGQPAIGTKKPNLSLKKGSSSSEEPLASPSVLNAWASCAMNLDGFAPSKLAQADLVQYKQKTHGFLIPHLQSSSLSDKEAKLVDLASNMADSLIKETGTSIDDAGKKQLIETMKKALAQDLPVKVSAKTND